MSRRKITRFLDVFFGLVVGGAFLIWASLSIGTWAGRLSPAAAPMTEVQAVMSERGVVFSGRSARLLPSCAPRELRWRLGDRGGQNAPVTVDWGPPILHPNGEFTFSGWVANMDNVDEFLFRTHGDVLHRCYVMGVPLPFLWRSRFWN